MKRRIFLKNIALVSGWFFIDPFEAIEILKPKSTTFYSFPSENIFSIGELNELLKKYYIPQLVEHFNSSTSLLPSHDNLICKKTCVYPFKLNYQAEV